MARTRLCSGLSCGVQCGSMRAEGLAQLHLVPDLGSSYKPHSSLVPLWLALRVVMLWALGTKVSGAPMEVGVRHLSVARADYSMD